MKITAYQSKRKNGMKIYFLVRDIWYAIGNVPYGDMIQEGIIAAVSLESIGFFLLTTLRAFMRGLRRPASTGRKTRVLSRTAKLKGAARMSKHSYDRDAEGYKNFHPGEKGPADNVPEELKKAVGIDDGMDDGTVVSLARARRRIRKG